MSIIDRDHHSIVSSSLVKEICYPFFRDTGLTDFVHARIYDNNEIYSLNSNIDWQLLHCDAGHLVTPPLPKGINSNSNRYAFMLTLETAPEPFVKTILAFQQILQMDYPYFIIERYDSFYDLYVFCTSVGNQDIINFYINEQKYIEKFKQYFLEKAKLLLRDAKSHKIIVPPSLRTSIPWENNNINRENFLCKNFNITYDNRVIVFTAKEAECLKHFGCGFDTKTVAKMMKISPRTVEFHVKNIKQKMNLTSFSAVMTNLNRLEIPIQHW